MVTRNDVQRLYQEIVKLCAEGTELNKVIAQQQEQITALTKENQELKEK
jgi:cell division protein FtsB